jgi:hypothetical protein
MKFRLVSALRTDGTPVLFDGVPQGRVYPFFDLRDVVVVRTEKRCSQTEAARLIETLQKALTVRVIVVDDSVEILILESRFGALLRKIRFRLLPLTAPLVSFWRSARAKFALLRLKS